MNPASEPIGSTPQVTLYNDGIADIVQNAAGSQGEFTVSISNGDGTFKAPVTYKINSSGSGPAPIASGDFNGDGKVDLAVAVPGTNQVAVYVGNGDGTFQAPKTSTLNLPSNIMLAASPTVAADFNHDSKLDLVAAAHISNGPWSVYLLEGDGTGGFAISKNVYNPTVYAVHHSQRWSRGSVDSSPTKPGHRISNARRRVHCHCGTHPPGAKPLPRSR
jgi:hypothetical protein